MDTEEDANNQKDQATDQDQHIGAVDRAGLEPSMGAPDRADGHNGDHDKEKTDNLIPQRVERSNDAWKNGCCEFLED